MILGKRFKAVLALSSVLSLSSVLFPLVAQASSGSGSVVSASKTSSTETSLVTSNFSASTYVFSKSQIAALNKLNAIRGSMGIHPVQLSPVLCQAATNHDLYIGSNGGYLALVSPHYEVHGKPDFTGVGPTDRVIAVGGSSYNDGMSIGEVIAGGNNSVQAVIRLIDTPLHRDGLLDPSVTQIGVSNLSTACYVIDTYTPTSYSVNSNSSIDGVYPYNGQKNVPILFFGDTEVPDPIAQFNLSMTGYPISYLPPADLLVEGSTNMHFLLEDSNGNSVPCIEDRVDAGDGIIFFPKSKLHYNEKYTASLSYRVKDTYYSNSAGKIISKWVSVSKTWSFTTMANPEALPKPLYYALEKGVRPIGYVYLDIHTDPENIAGMGYFLKLNDPRFQADSIVAVYVHNYKSMGGAIPRGGFYYTSKGYAVSFPVSGLGYFFIGYAHSATAPMVVHNKNGSIFETVKANQYVRIRGQNKTQYLTGYGRYISKSQGVIFQAEWWPN